LLSFKKTAVETEYVGRHSIDLSTEVVTIFPNGGKVVVYNAIDRTTEDFHRILACAKYFAKCGKQVVMPPKLDVPYKNPAYNQIFGSLRGTPYYGKCPDMLVDNKWYEHEGFVHVNPKMNFSNMCKRGFRQSDRIIIEKCNLTDGYMLRSIEGQKKSGVRITELWVHEGNDCRQIYKN